MKIYINPQQRTIRYGKQEIMDLTQETQSGILLIEFMEDVERMRKLYRNQKYTESERLRDYLAEKLDFLRTENELFGFSEQLNND